MNRSEPDKRPTATLPLTRAALAAVFCLPITSYASLFQGETLDAVADVASWVVLFVAPLLAIGIFLMVHIMPEKIAEKKNHPQAKAIQTLCILSLFFGGLLWPLAWLWAYSKPVLYKMAYGTDEVPHGEEANASSAPAHDEYEEVRQLSARIAELEARLAAKARKA
jgi:CBS domain containing-hemolysin-like protein